MDIKLILTEPQIGGQTIISGWIRTKRDSKDFSFLEINDGSCLKNLQVIAARALPNYDTQVSRLTTGCSVRVTGQVTSSPAKGQTVELQAETLEVIGWAPADSYPLQKKRHSFEFLREISHLRPRTNSLGAVMRIRSHLSFAVHQYFQDNNFFLVHTPIITTSDCEGAGEMFAVTTTPKKGSPDQTPPRDFFGNPAGLTVSGQLQAEAYALALGKVYTFGPTFRAENSNTSRHLAEFWMIEPEMAFCDLDGDIALATDFLKYLIKSTLKNCPDDLELFDRFIAPGLITRLEGVLDRSFTRISYTEAVALLAKSKQNFEYPVSWGTDLQSEHEKFLTDVIMKSPVVVTDYPSAIKPFYMRVNNDKKTVAAMDILFPTIGEIIGGSQREEREDILLKRMLATGIDPDQYQWYIDLRRYGTVPHAGFGLGFERMVQYITGMTNIRDVIPFPRTPGHADL
ncbi:MAG: asparagine--tRNA ligase [Proteobacteria bacterium]|nr:asparagine--tRNA ligase [Pseudomonadota bacterium]MBU1685827.1 asparagine--tRNA ligase [Pseudomonadota bacterium]